MTLEKMSGIGAILYLLLVSKLFWRAPVMLLKLPVKIAAVVIADGISDCLHRKGRSRQQIGRLLQFPLLEQFFEIVPRVLFQQPADKVDWLFQFGGNLR